jgi:hypothetical protein
LDGRERREGERAGVKRPGPERHQPTNGKPFRAKQVGRASQRVPDVHGGCQDRAAVLEQEGGARRHGAGDGEDDPGDHAYDRPPAAITRAPEPEQRSRLRPSQVGLSATLAG